MTISSTLPSPLLNPARMATVNTAPTMTIPLLILSDPAAAVLLVVFTAAIAITVSSQMR